MYKRQEQGKVVFITVAGYVIVLVGKFHAFLLCTQVCERGEKVDVVRLYTVFYLFLCQ